MTFHILKTKDIPPIAIEWLKGSVERTPIKIETVESLLGAVNHEVYLIKKDDEVYGAVYMMFRELNGRKFLNIIAIGGKQLHRWRKTFRDYAYNLLLETNSELCIMTESPAWGRLFQLKTTGYIYSV